MGRIEVRDLRKRFGRMEVLKGINLTVESGEVVAILGPNASGKTTLLKSILGLVLPDKGVIRVNGVDVREGFLYKEMIGYMPQEPSFPENITPSELIALISDLRGIFPKEEIDRLMDIFSLNNHMTKPMKALSGGTKQKINAVLALAFDPEFLILDEPTAGLDPISSTKLKEEILSRKNNGKGIILTTHVISEAEELSDRILFLIEGSVKVDMSVKELKDRTGEKTLEKALAKILEEKDA